MKPQRLYNENINRTANFQAQKTRTLVDSALEIKSYFGDYFIDKSTVTEDRLKNNRINMMSGIFGGCSFSKDDTIIVGQSGATFTGLVTIEKRTRIVFQNVTFRQKPFEDNDLTNNQQYLINIKEGARVQFINCVFERTSKYDERNTGKFNPASTKSFLALDTTAAETIYNMMGCIFTQPSDSGATSLVQNLSTGAGTGNIAFSINQTGVATGAGVATGLLV